MNETIERNEDAKDDGHGRRVAFVTFGCRLNKAEALDLEAQYAAADFIICRAGALTIAELAAAGLGGILVPFPFAVDDHQTKNAQYLVQGKAALCVPQPEFTVEKMSKQINELTREQCLEWATNARKLAKPHAADDIANAVLACVK